MVARSYTPNRGDLVWINFTPHSGHEQAGPRPALVISPKAYNKLTGLTLVCPITSKQKGYNFELPLHSEKIRGVVLVDQIRNVDFSSRKIRFIENAEPTLVKRAQQILGCLITESPE